MGQKDCGKNIKRKGRKWKIAAAALCSAAILLFLGCAVYVGDYHHADSIAEKALLPDEEVNVAYPRDGIIVFSPVEPVAGLIFYPGGKVEYTAYAPLLRGLAEQGILCVLIRMPWNLAVLDSGAADGIQEEFPEIENWYIGGHSLGGSMAGSYAAEHTEEYKGIVLLAAYVTDDIRQSGLEVISIYGDRDEVLDMGKYTDYLANLPEDMEECVIAEGCHAQFGSYGAQKGDGTPGISGEEQRAITIERIVDWMEDDALWIKVYEYGLSKKIQPRDYLTRKYKLLTEHKMTGATEKDE